METVFPYVPLEEKGWRMAMGLRPLDVAKWLEVDAKREAELELKRQLLDDSYDVVVATNPEGDDASRELLDEVRANLATHHPGLATEVSAGDHPVVAASRLVQEDLCVLVRSDAWRLQAASVCFPSRWSLVTKIGTTLDDIHRPIPFYDDQLASPTNSFFDRLRPERSFWRLNWTLIDSAVLHQPTMERKPLQSDLSRWFFRVERQTLRRLSRSGGVVFTIHNYVASAKEMCELHEDFGALLLRSLDSTPGPMQDYKGWRGVADELRAALSDADARRRQ
jgi:hypothetical protein